MREEARGHHRPESEIEATLARREGAPEDVASVLSHDVVPGSGVQASRGWRALSAWRAVNGEIERRHTTGVYLDEPRGRETLPSLLVYVDSKACEVDFRANAEIYVARLAQAGLPVARVTFRQSKRRVAAAEVEAPARPAEPEPLPELTAAEEAEADALLCEVPEALKPSVSRALRNSLRREKKYHS